MRITSGMISRQYNSNLNQATYQLNKAATTAYDYRAFEKPSEDPFLAGQTFQVRRQLGLNESYSSNISSLKGEVSSATSTLDTVYGILTNAKTSILAAITASTSESDRDIYANKLETMQKAILSDMNAEYGNRYLFSGAGGYGEAPFSVDSSGNLLYRGINVDTGENTNGASATINYDYTDADNVTTAKTMQIDFGTGIYDKLNGYTVSLSVSGTSNTVSVDTAGKTISITMENGATKQGLQDFLQGSDFQSALSSIDSSITADDVKQITISGLDEPGVGDDAISESGTVSSSVSGDFSAFSYNDADNISGTLRINFSGASTSYEGYTVSLGTGASTNTVSVDNDNKTITIRLQDGATRSDLQSLLQSQVDGGIDVTLDAGDAIYEPKTSISSGITNFVDLADLAKETSYVDIGLGIKTDANGNVVDQSAFNAAMPGISFLGYGTTTEGGTSIPNNAYSLLGRMADILRDGSMSGEDLIDTLEPYTDAFNDAMDEFSSQKAQLGTDATFLDSTSTFITNVNLNLTQKDEDVEYVDTTDAITNYSMQIFCYQAALQVGSSILQPTLLDFMK
ncbi:hypothetical protein EQM14_13530 [Caproiciproducens sp. NJN-50]|uniref:flagellin N-terminal helical domain-containing protein n=1 Tax=Caproiciproducens sp. NJN-50 TaxID=2507162 RepID=UPI000FFE29D7|nr:flagellin [Caproiciproducens sp. NJN-50]QAT50700.1 hypothetical protein EQM14_13530 [Caproiciproducens sp. NJN-50]